MIFFLFACRTAVIDENWEHEGIEEQQEDYEIRDSINSSFVDSLLHYLNADIQVIDNRYSRPDTNGIQHLLQQKIYNVALQSEENRIRTENTTKKSDMDVHQNASKTEKNEKRLQKETEFNTFKPPNAFLTIVIIILLIIFFHKIRTR